MDTAEKARERMRRWRETEKGKAYMKRYNLRYKRPDMVKNCVWCDVEFVTARKSQECCSECSRGGGYAQKKYRQANKQKVYARGVFRRDEFKGTCIICGQPGERHHPDYANPKEVIWFCKAHHWEHHDNIKAE